MKTARAAAKQAAAAEQTAVAVQALMEKVLELEAKIDQLLAAMDAPKTTTRRSSSK